MGVCAPESQVTVMQKQFQCLCVFLSHRISHYRAIKANANTHTQTGYAWLTAHSEMPGRKQQKKSNTHTHTQGGNCHFSNSNVNKYEVICDYITD